MLHNSLTMAPHSEHQSAWRTRTRVARLRAPMRTAFWTIKLTGEFTLLTVSAGLKNKIFSYNKSQNKMGLHTRKPVFGVCKQQKRRPACAYVQSDQAFVICSLERCQETYLLVCKQQKHRSASTSVQSDQRLCYSLFGKYHNY